MKAVINVSSAVLKRKWRIERSPTRLTLESKILFAPRATHHRANLGHVPNGSYDSSLPEPCRRMDEECPDRAAQTICNVKLSIRRATSRGI